MQNDHGADQLANSWSDLARIFSHADSNTPASDSSTQLLNSVPRHPSLHDLFANDQDERLIHPLGDHNISLDPASIEVPNFPALPLLTTSTRSHANSAESCTDSAQLIPHENPSAVPLVTWVSNPASIAGKGHHELEDELAFARACMLAFKTNATSRTGSYAGLSDFGLGAGKGAISFKQSGKPGVLSESVRRKQLTHLFYTLRSLLPNIAPKHDRCNVIDKTCDYIKSLEREVQVLKRKAGILTSVIESNGDPKSNAEDLDGIIMTTEDANDVRRASSSMSIPCAADEIEKACSNLETPHVQIYLAGDSSINVNIGCYEGRRGLFSALLNIFERRHLEVLNANRSQQGHVVLYAIHLKAQQSSCPLELDIKELKEQLYAEAVATMLL